MTEDEGCARLLARFTAAGYAIVPAFAFREGDIDVELDGWDAEARVGYEYITREADDHREFDAKALAQFEARMANGELFVLLVDERDAVTADALDAAADGFLAAIADRRKAARGSGGT